MMLKNPTWRSLSPGLPSYVLLGAEKALVLQNTIGLFGVIFQVFFDGEDSHCYRLDEAKTKKKYFIKQIPVQHYTHYSKVEALACWLQHDTIQINVSIKAVAAEGSYYVIYPLLEGIRVDPSQKSMVLLAQSLALFHQRLNHYPSLDVLQLNTERRLSALEDIRQQIARGQLMMGPVASYVKALAQCSALSFTNGYETQALHGDLNPGNCILQHDRICFLDFEDTLHSILPTIYELAYVLERMVFTRMNNTSEMVHLGKSFIHAYLGHHGRYVFHKSDITVLSTLALRAFCVLTLCELEGNTIHESEWYKFRALAELAKKNQDLLKIILQV